MLDTRHPPQIIAGVPVFHDHEDERRRYPVASVPRIVTDPEPQISLVLFREPEPGGLLQFAVELRPTNDELEAIRRELSTSGPPPRLLRPDWRAGRVSLLGWLDGPELPPRELVIGEASLVGDPMAIVSARLDAAGAALAEAALRGDMLPTVVLFEVETLGLEGPVQAKARADLRAIHERLTAEGALTTPYGKARLAATWESMLRENLIRIEVTAETVHADMHRTEALRRVGMDIVSRMFSPVPPAERPSRLDNGAIAPIELSFRLTARRETLATSASWDFSERRAAPLRHYAAASLVDMLGPGARAPIVLADIAELRRTLVVRAEPELPRLGLSALEVDVRESSTGEPAHTVVLTNEAPEVRLTAKSSAPSPAFRVRTHFDPTLTSAANRQSDWQDMPGALAVVSARRLFPPRTISILAGQAEFDWLEEVQARLTVEGEPVRVVRLTQDKPAATVFLAGGEGKPAWLEMSWRGGQGEPSRVEEPRLLTDDTVVVDSPFGPSMNVAVLVASGRLQGVANVVVQLRSVQPGFTHERTIEFQLPTDKSQRVSLRRAPGAPRQYDFRAQYVREDGTVVDEPWKTTGSMALLVGADDTVRVDEVEVFVGGGPKARGSAGIEFSLSSGGATTTVLLEGTADLARLALVLPREAPAPVLLAREFREAGQVLETRWSPPERFVVMPPLVPEL